MEKLYYNREGWLCRRAPLNLDVTEDCFEIEVDEATYSQTLSVPVHFAWRYSEGKLSAERVEDTPAEEVSEARKDFIRARLVSLTEDMAQYAAGEEIPDVEDRKSEFISLHNELRTLLGLNVRTVR